MGRKDLTGKIFFSDQERFAELINVILYHGKEMVKPENLVRMEREYPSPLGNGEKHRDILMRDSRHNICYGLEIETESDYSMPERVMVYDVCEWETQIREISKALEKKSYRDRKSRIGRDEFLTPVITVVLYLGVGRWQGRRKMAELFCVSEEIRNLLGNALPDYEICLAEAEFMNAEKYQTDLREFFYALQCRSDKMQLAKLLCSGRFRNLKKDTEWVIATYLDRNGLAEKMRKEGLSMCQALDELMEDKRQEGKKEGKREGRIEGQRKGRKEERISIIGRMLQEGIDRSLIGRITDCTEKELMLAANNDI